MASFNQTVGQLTGLGGTIKNTTASTTSTLTISGSDTSASAYSGTIADGGSGKVVALTRSGTGKTILSGTNTYSGGTTVGGGTLTTGSNTALGTNSVAINSGGMLSIGNGFTHSNAITVNSGGILGGTGTFSGTVSLASGGTIAPGNSPGQITKSGALTFSSGSIYSWDLNLLSGAVAGTNYDQILNISGRSISLTSAATLTPVITASIAPGTDGSGFWNSNHTWTVVSSSGTGTVTGTALGTTNSYGSYGTFSTTINGQNLDLTWTATAIPEPATYAAMVGAVALVGAFWHRRRQRQKFLSA